MDSTKLLTEKLTLARELSALKPELDYLRSQAAIHQSLLADKLSLQRQLSTVQVELTTEKRAAQRALAKEETLQVEDAKLQSRLESLQADLVKECRERQRVERDAKKGSTESENRITTLESRLDAFRNKLKLTKEQLKEAQVSIHSKSSHASTSVKPVTSLMVNPSKRGAAQMDVDTILGTPGDLPAAKKSKWGSTLVGEKSTFSITPFLNRTASVAPESPPPGKASGVIEINKQGLDQISMNTSQKQASSKATSDLVGVSLTLTDKMRADKSGMLRKAEMGTINTKVPPARKTKAAGTLDQVAEENIENVRPDTNISEPAIKKTPSSDVIHENFEMKRRKRKLLGGLGKTLLDDDDEDAFKGDQGLILGVRGLGAPGNGRLRVPNVRPRQAAGCSESNFGAISPLKKDRRVLSSG